MIRCAEVLRQSKYRDQRICYGEKFRNAFSIALINQQSKL